MENIGALALLLAFCLAIYAVIGSVVGKIKRKPFLIVSAERAVYSMWFLVTLAAGLLVYSLITGDFRMAYVAAHSNRAMSTLYKFAAWWGGQEGSLLLWAWLLSTYTMVVVFMNRRKFRDMMPYVTAILTTTLAFFLLLVTFVASPFQVLAAGKGITDVGDGRGLDPLLQYWTMAIHPPFLYLGYVGFTVPFAFAIGVADHQAERRSLDLYHAPLDAGDVAVPKHRNHARRWLGLLGSRLGRLLGLGSGGERLASSLDHGHCVPSLRHDAGEEGHDEGLERGPDFLDVLPLHLWNIADPHAASCSRCMHSRSARSASYFVTFLAVGIAAIALSHPRPAGLSQERSAPRKRGFARIELPV